MVDFIREFSNKHDLSEKEYDVLREKFVSKLTYIQIAKKLGITLGATHKRMGQVYKKVGITGGKGKEIQLRKAIYEESSVVTNEHYSDQDLIAISDLLECMEDWRNPARCIKRAFKLLQEQDPVQFSDVKPHVREEIHNSFELLSQQSLMDSEELVVKTLECISSMLRERIKYDIEENQ